MGQYEQPVVGMKSCIDLSDATDLHEWNAREWFIVRQAEVLMTQDNVLVPRVKMGVEAREQVVVNDGLEDKVVTSASHPLVQYAEQFTHYFDLIAERKSVIYHLRNLAKASVMAKMMVEADVNAEGPWLDLAGESKEVSSMEVPQLWNHLLRTQVQVRDNQVVSASDKVRSRGVYGGVQFGLDKTPISVPTLKPRAASVVARPAVSLSAVTRVTPSLGITAKPVEAAVPAPGVAAAAPKAKAVPTKPRITAAKGTPAPSRKVGISTVVDKPSAVTAHGVTPLSFALVEGKPIDKPGVSAARLMAMPTSRTPLMPLAGVPPKPSVPVAPVLPARPELRGVDLNLDQFSFSEPTRVEGMSWGIDNEVKCASLGSSFWSSLESGTDFHDEAKKLLQQVFNPKLSDRREEGEQFVPPETCYDYVKSLSTLVDEEQKMCEQRKQHFLSKEFSVSNPGEVFPKSWAPSVEIVSEKAQSSQLHERSDYMAQTGKFAQIFKSTTPTFDKMSEDGVCYRMYQIGSLQVRTIQECNEEEVVGAVYSTNAAAHDVEGMRVNESDKIVKVMEYIEKVHGARRSYIVLETENGSTIVTEKRRDGAVTWEKNPTDLQDRNALAKCVRSADCNDYRVTVGCMKSLQTKDSRLSVTNVSASECKRYAQGVFSRAVGKAGSIYTGFRKNDKKLRWQLL